MDRFNEIGVIICPPPPHETFSTDHFHIIRETLERMGLKNHFLGQIVQSAHLLHKQGTYKIVHFKEMFYLDGKPTRIEQQDLDRRNFIVRKLVDWNLISCPEKMDGYADVDIIPFEQKHEWILKQNYTIGKRGRTYIE